MSDVLRSPKRGVVIPASPACVECGRDAETFERDEDGHDRALCRECTIHETPVRRTTRGRFDEGR